MIPRMLTSCISSSNIYGVLLEARITTLTPDIWQYNSACSIWGYEVIRSVQYKSHSAVAVQQCTISTRVLYNYYFLSWALCCTAGEKQSNRGRVYKDSFCILSLFSFACLQLLSYIPILPYSHVLASSSSTSYPPPQMEIHSTPSSSCSSSSSHLIPPPFSGPEPRQ